ALAAGGTLRVTYSTASACHVSADEFSGLTGTDRVASAFATSSSFNSGSTATTSQATELLFGVLGEESGVVPSWATGWTALPTLSISSDRLSAAYRMVSATGAYAASGTASGTWMATIVTYTSGPQTDNPPAANLAVVASGLTVTADGSGSTDSDTTPIATYRFSFGDGSAAVTTTAPTATASHTYAAAGTYTVTLLATDTGGKQSAPVTASVTVTASPPDNPPVASLLVG